MDSPEIQNSHASIDLTAIDKSNKCSNCKICLRNAHQADCENGCRFCSQCFDSRLIIAFLLLI